MLAATVLLLLGSLFVLSAHGQGELDVALEQDYGEMTGLKIRPQNQTYGSYRYIIPSYKAKWIDAVVDCGKMGGNLTDVRSRDELDFLQSLSKQTGDRYAHWVGAGALGLNKSFVWVSDKSQVGVELWRTDKPEPNVNNGNCVYMLWKNVPAGLAVFHCNEDQRGFICKFPMRK